ncbi:hypothetical protein BF33_5611 (plasmid) [Bacillus cereus]|nr:hypothetical protein BG11_5742 [Bacillus cereus]AJK37590.1 hypothetical protein BF33_5611 [Bacillus cereus]
MYVKELYKLYVVLSKRESNKRETIKFNPEVLILAVIVEKYSVFTMSSLSIYKLEQ